MYQTLAIHVTADKAVPLSGAASAPPRGVQTALSSKLASSKLESPWKLKSSSVISHDGDLYTMLSVAGAAVNIASITVVANAVDVEIGASGAHGSVGVVATGVTRDA